MSRKNVVGNELRNTFGSTISPAALHIILFLRNAGQKL
jgi:hypothetical protein